MPQIQVFNPTPVPSAASNLGQTLGLGLTGYLQGKEQAQQRQQLSNMLFGDQAGMVPNLSPEQLLTLHKSLGEQQKRQQANALMESIYGGGEGKPQQSIQPGQPSQPGEIKQKEGFDPLNIPDETIAKLASVNPAVSRELRAAKDAAEAKKQDLRKETLPLRKEIADKAKFSRQAIENKKAALKLLETGKIDDPLTVGLAEYLPGAIKGKILSPETQLYKAGLFEEFGVLKNMFPGAIRVKEIELLEDKLATLDKSHEAKRAILENGIKKAERDIIIAEAARKVDKENPGLSYLDYEEKVAEKAKPQLEKLFDEIVEGYNKIYFEFAPNKNNFVDQNGQEYRNVPKEELKQLFDEAKAQGIELKAIS